MTSIAHSHVSIQASVHSVPSLPCWFGEQVVFHLDARLRCMEVLLEQHPIKVLPLRGLVGQHLSFQQFLTHMLHQARAQTRLRSLQERKYRTAAKASP
jgi:hypothetical protein